MITYPIILAGIVIFRFDHPAGTGSNPVPLCVNIQKIRTTGRTGNALQSRISRWIFHVDGVMVMTGRPFEDVSVVS